MKSPWLTILLAAAALVVSCQSVDSRDPTAREEERCIAVLRSDRTPKDKDAACVQLHRIATDRAVPALAALLGHPDLSHSARHVLESMPSPAAGRALTAALQTTSGLEQLGIISSLGARREPQAIAALAPLLADASLEPVDTQRDGDRVALAAAAAAALGEIDGPDAIAALERAWNGPAQSIRHPVADALLRHANRRLAAGDRREARRIFDQLYRRETDERLRMAAFQGVIRSAGEDGLRLLSAALAGPSPTARHAALRLVPDLPLTGASAEFAKLLPTLPAPRQVALLDAWTQRPESPPLETVAPLLNSDSPEVRVSAIRALARVGDASVVVPLAEAAATPGSAQAPARLALREMSAANVSARLIALLDAPRPEVQIEAARAVGDRGEKAATAALLGLANPPSTAVRQAVLRALIVLLDERQLDGLVRLVVDAGDESVRAEAARAVALTYERISPRQASPAVQPLLDQLARGATPVRVALLPACHSLALLEIRGALRAAIADRDPAIRSAAIQATSQTVDLELLPDLIALASRSRDDESRDLGTTGCVRLIATSGNRISTARRIEIFRTLASGPVSPARKRTLLTGLSAGWTLAELKLAESLFGDDFVRTEAIDAILKIAPRVGDTEAATAILRRAESLPSDPTTHAEITRALARLESRAGFVTSWQTASFPRPGNRVAAHLLDVPFAPETRWSDFRVPHARIRLANWEPMMAGADAKKPMLMRGGGPPVFTATYAYTWLRSPRAQDARLELEHDAGIKVWHNGELALRASPGGPLPRPETTRVKIRLNAGWNLLALKIAQPGRPWSFSVRIRKVDGSPLPDVVADAEAEP